MNRRNRLICVWSGYAFLPLYGIGFVLFAGFIPVPSPMLEIAQIIANFEKNRTGILIGMIICIFASGCLVPWSVAIFNLMSRIEDNPKVLSYAQLTAGALGVVFFMAPCFVWGAMAYRAGHSPEIMQFMSDLAWISWIISVPTFVLQSFVIGLCALSGNREQNVIPRWLAYLSLWVGVTLIPAGCVLMFKSGPFAWNGLIAVYVPLTIYVIWYHAMLVILLRTTKQPAGQQPAPSILPA